MSSPIKRKLAAQASPVRVKRRRSSSPDLVESSPKWEDWPAPSERMEEARRFILDIVERRLSVLIVPDKDADGLSAGSILYKTFTHLGHSEDLIKVHHLTKGTNLHTEVERDNMEAAGTDKVVVLDQGSRPGRALVRAKDPDSKRTLIIDHHMSDEFPAEAQVLTACQTPPIATAALLTYLMLRPLHPNVQRKEGWRAVVGAHGDLGPVKWGTEPWPAELGDTLKAQGSKNISDAVAGVNAPRRTAEYDVPKAWSIMLAADSAAQVANNAFLKLCRLDVTRETERWARTPPKFSLDGRVAVVTVNTGFQVHPVIATRWAGNLGRKSKKLIMVMCANTGFQPDPNKVSFSCRIASGLRALPEGERPDLIALLKEYGDSIEGFRERVGDDFARGHKEATGGIIAKAEFELLLEAIGVPTASSPKKAKEVKPKIIDAGQKNDIRAFFKTAPTSAVAKEEEAA